MSTIIDLQGIEWRREGQMILQPFDWQVRKGEHWAILGLNGSGKTSILNIVSGYTFPSTGRVTVFGETYGKTYLPDLRKRIGYVSSALDRFSMYLERESVERIVVSGKFASFGLYEETTDADFQAARKILQDLRLEKLTHQRFNLLSQGEQRRVLIARALMSEPDLLILDEPCSGLDILSREQVVDLLAIVAPKTTILYVTHHIDELVPEITHCLLLHHGKVVAQGPKEEVLTAEQLSTIYELPVTVSWTNKRPFLQVQNE